MIAPFAEVQAPVIDYEALSPLMATVGGSIVVLTQAGHAPEKIDTKAACTITTMGSITASTTAATTMPMTMMISGSSTVASSPATATACSAPASRPRTPCRRR